MATISVFDSNTGRLLKRYAVADRDGYVMVSHGGYSSQQVYVTAGLNLDVRLIPRMKLL